MTHSKALLAIKEIFPDIANAELLYYLKQTDNDVPAAYDLIADSNKGMKDAVKKRRSSKNKHKTSVATVKDEKPGEPRNFDRKPAAYLRKEVKPAKIALPEVKAEDKKKSTVSVPIVVTSTTMRDGLTFADILKSKKQLASEQPVVEKTIEIVEKNIEVEPEPEIDNKEREETSVKDIIEPALPPKVVDTAEEIVTKQPVEKNKEEEQILIPVPKSRIMQKVSRKVFAFREEPRLMVCTYETKQPLVIPNGLLGQLKNGSIGFNGTPGVSVQSQQLPTSVAPHQDWDRYNVQERFNKNNNLQTPSLNYPQPMWADQRQQQQIPQNWTTVNRSQQQNQWVPPYQQQQRYRYQQNANPYHRQAQQDNNSMNAYASRIQTNNNMKKQ